MYYLCYFNTDFLCCNTYRRVISIQILRHPSSLTVFEDFIFFTEWKTGTIRRLGKDGQGNEVEIHQHLQRPGPIRILHPSLTPYGNSFHNLYTPFVISYAYI